LDKKKRAAWPRALCLVFEVPSEFEGAIVSAEEISTITPQVEAVAGGEVADCQIGHCPSIGLVLLVGSEPTAEAEVDIPE